MDIGQSIHNSIQYIHSKYTEPITVTDIASEVYLSPSYFSFVFRAFTGYTVKNYLNRYRLHQCAIDLVESNKQLVEIAYTHGFSSQQSFTRSFSQLYGVTPAQFRLQRPTIDPFPEEKLLEKRRNPSMELKQTFENVNFIHKKSFYVVGMEVDIDYNDDNGTSPISNLWSMWNDKGFAEIIPNQVSKGMVYGITHSETADSKAKYFVGVEVNNPSNLPTELVGRKFEASEFAVFDTTLEVIWTGGFWRTFYSHWLQASGYALHDEQYRNTYATFCKYPAIEVYNKDFKDQYSKMQIYAPVVKKQA